MTRIILLALCIITSSVFGQAKKPTIMIVPSDNWCNTNGYMISVDNQGIQEKRPDYEKALLENTELNNVIIAIGGLMADRGFPLQTLDEAIKKVKQDAAENLAMQSKSGSTTTESSYDKLMNTVKADIYLKVGWKVTTSGFDESVQLSIQAIDAYTGKQIASVNPPGSKTSTVPLPTMLSTAILSVIDNFNSRLQEYFDDLFKNGREVIIKCSKFYSWDGDFEKEYEVNGEKKELSSIIEDWMSKNTVNGRFNNSDATENKLLFEQVRIPMYNAAGKAIDCKDFCKELQKYLNSSPFNITTKLVKKGLGQTWIIFGEK